MSSGARFDLFILFLARSVLRIGLSEQDLEGAIERNREDNRLHKVNKRIDRRIESVLMKIESVLSDIARVTPDAELAKIQRWIKRKNETGLLKVLSRVESSGIQLEMLGLYLLFTNFCERKLPLLPVFEPFTDANMYFEEIELLQMTNLTPDDEQSAMDFAYKIIKGLR